MLWMKRFPPYWLRDLLLSYGVLVCVWTPPAEAHGHNLPEEPEGLQELAVRRTESPAITFDEAVAWARHNHMLDLTPRIIAAVVPPTPANDHF